MGIITGTLFVGLMGYIAKWFRNVKIDFHRELERSKTLRVMGSFDQARKIQEHLLQVIEGKAKSQQYGMSAEEFYLIRGLVYEELAEIYAAQNDHEKAHEYAQLALQDLEQNEMFVTTCLERIERLKKL